MWMQAIQKICEAKYPCINFIFFEFVKKYIKKVGSHPGYAESPGFRVNLACRLSLTGLIANPGFAYLKPDQDPRLPGLKSTRRVMPSLVTMISMTYIPFCVCWNP
jgi:hypothetical protein